MRPARPDFLVIGAPKAGTTALHASLAAHPRLFLSAVKEPKFFLSDGPPPTHGGPGDRQTYGEHVWRPADYAALFEQAPPDALRGEATPFYLHDLAAQARIAAALPDAKLIAVLREPVDRAYSNWAHLRSAGLEPITDFAAACAAQDARRAMGWAPFWHYVDLGLYGEQVSHLFSLVDPARVLLLRYKELHDEPVPTLDRVCAFLGVETGLLAAVREENVRTFVEPGAVNDGIARVLRAGAAIGHRFPPPVRVAARRPLLAALHREGRRKPSITDEQWRAVEPRFAADIDVLSKVTGKSYDDWHTPPSARPRVRAR